MLTEETVVDQITVLEDGQLQVRRATKVLRDGVEIAKTYHRHVVAPGADLSKEDARVQLVGQVLHTPEVVAIYEAALAPVVNTK